MLIQQIALIAGESQLDQGLLAHVAQVLEFQSQEFAKAWGVAANVTPYPNGESVPGWQIVVTSTFNTPGEAGVHRDFNNQPIAFVRSDPSWIVSASHEMLEMLADPTLSNVRPGPSPNPPRRPVVYLQEVCDPVQRTTYPIDGTYVCNFVTPAYYEPASPGAVYDRCNAVHGPLEILPGGYTTFQDGGFWWQIRRAKNGEFGDPIQGPPVSAGPPDASNREIVRRAFQTYELHRDLLEPEDQELQDLYHEALARRREEHASKLRDMFPPLRRAYDAALERQPRALSGKDASRAPGPPDEAHRLN